MIGPTLASLDGSTATFDATGHVFRFPASGSERTASDLLPCASFLTDPTRPEILACESLSQALSDYFSYRPISPGGNP
jgi:hypothetical protein